MLLNKISIVLLETNVVEDVLNGIGEAIGNALSAVWDTISSSLWNAFVSWLVTGLNDFVATIMSNLTAAPLQLFAERSVIVLLNFISNLGWALYIVGLILAVFEICIEYQSAGHFNIKRQFLPPLIGLFAVMLFDTVPILLYQLAVDQQSALMKLVLVGSVTDADYGELGMSAVIAVNHDLIDGAVKYASIGTLFYVLFLVAIIACIFIKVFFANMKRAGILLTMIGVGSLYMISIPRGYTDGFWSWTKQVVGLCVTTVLQNLLLFLGCIIISQGRFLVGIGVILASSEVPRIAAQFGLDTSAKTNFTSIAYSANAAISAARNISQLSRKAV